MEKPATAQYPIHDLLKQRWSLRAFSERPVEPEHLRSLLEAARWAPSSNNGSSPNRVGKKWLKTGRAQIPSATFMGDTVAWKKPTGS